MSLMRNTIFALFAVCFITFACVDKKAEEKKKEVVELEQKIDAVGKEVNQDVDSLEKEAKEIEEELKELDNL